MKIKLEQFEAIVWIAIILLIWEVASDFGFFNAFLMPPPSRIFLELLTFGRMQRHIIATLNEVVIGFSYAIVVGIAIAVVIAHFPRLRPGLYPILLFFQSVPKSALCPLFITWFGFGIIPKALVTFLITVFPILINTLTGLTFTDPQLLDMMHSLKASKWQIFAKVRLPNSYPYIFSGLKISAPLVVIGALVAEFIAGDAGLGYLIQLSFSIVNMPMLFSVLVIISIMGMGLFGAAVISEKLLLPWYKE